MDGVIRASFVGWMIVLLVGASCTRVPEENQAAPSAEWQSTDANSISIALSSPDTVSTDTKTRNQQKDVEFVRAAPPREIDINSGDVRGSRYRDDGSAHYGIYESELSKEVRRLGIPVPEQRDWWIIHGSSGGLGGMHVDPVYGNLLPTARRLLDRLDEVNAPNDERRDVLERFMTSLRNDRPLAAIQKGRMLIVEVCDCHGLQSPFVPGYTERLWRELRNEQE